MAWPVHCCSHACVQSRQVTGSIAHNPLCPPLTLSSIQSLAVEDRRRDREKHRNGGGVTPLQQQLGGRGLSFRTLGLISIHCTFKPFFPSLKYQNEKSPR